ncbi:MAG: hypothetical protein O3A63_11780, partial [Proteobacteria bacterium]|nr:hypothetical protein [Pseudomonadota bacterium]
FVTSAAGGVTSLKTLTGKPETSFLFDLNGGIPFAVLLGLALSGALKLLVDPRQISRYYGLKDAASVRVGMWVALVGILVIMMSLFPIGLYAHLLVDGIEDTDLIVPMLVNDPSVFPIFASDFLILAILAAAMSSMDSVLLVAASVFYRDICQVVKPAKDPLLWTRMSVIGFAVVSAILALRPVAGIVEITVFSGSLYAVCFLPAILLGLHWRRGSGIAVLASMSLGVLVLVGWLLLGLRSIMHEVFPALVVSLTAYVLVAKYSQPALLVLPCDELSDA